MEYKNKIKYTTRGKNPVFFLTLTKLTGPVECPVRPPRLPASPTEENNYNDFTEGLM